MSLTAGTKIGAYEITAPLGAGGMGVVFKARDTRLGRDVAIKVLPDHFAGDPDRLARFQREAQVLASLNHSNIAHVYGLEEFSQGRCIVMELVDGETLAERIGRGPVPADEALEIAKQIAEALETAHEQGIIHRDLKPGNVMLQPDGKVKVLDFGLAKGTTSGPSGDFSNSPTLLSNSSGGIIMGTTAYMSPEQARGRTVDRRGDVWAFGCVLFEMLTGRRAFEGEDATDVIAAIVKSEPSWSLLPGTVPENVRFLLQRCLEKNPKRRLHDLADFRILLDAPPASAPPAALPSNGRRTVAAVTAAAVLAAALTALAAWTLRPDDPSQPVRRFAITLPSGDQFSADRHLVALSPAGTHLVYVANQRLYLRTMNQLEAEPIRGTEGGPADHARSPFWSPDGQWIGFWQAGQLKKVAVTGGAPVTLCKAENITGASWGVGDVIIFGQGPSGIWQVPGTGGQESILIPVDAAKGEAALHGPQLLPGGKAVLFTLRNAAATNWNEAQVVVQTLATGERRVIDGGTDARYLSTGHLLYLREGVLLAVPFDISRIDARAGPVPMVEGVSSSAGAVNAGGSGAAHFTVSDDGLMAYVPSGSGSVARTLVWVDRQGREESLVGVPARAYVYPRISPDGTRLALDIRDQENDIWIWDFSRATLARVTADPATDILPVWTPDGRRVVFSSSRAGQQNLFWQAADGTGAAERLSESLNLHNPYGFSSDGTRLLFGEQEPTAEYDLGILNMTGERRVELLTQTTFNERNASISPNGRWAVFQSNESGREEIYLRSFPDMKGPRQLVSNAGGTRPVWARSGREVFYLQDDRTLMTVPVQTTPALTIGKPIKLFEGSYFARLNGRTYDVSPDAQRFLMIKENNAAVEDGPQIIVVENWFEELKARVPVP